MQLRFSTARGTPILCDSTHALLGTIAGILIHPDTGVVEGFFVHASAGEGNPFLASIDIVRWGQEVHVHDPDAVFPVQERIRLQPLVEDERPVLGQRIRTEDGRALGRCRDVQFDTKSMRCQWLFPRRFWRWQRPVPVADIVEIRRDAIIVCNPERPVAVQEEVAEATSPLKILKQLPDAG